MTGGERRRRRATVVGAGGLGGPIALGLAADGVHVTVCDPDVVDLSNLHRQIAFVGDDVGLAKARRLVDAIVADGGTGTAHHGRFEAATAEELLRDAGLVIDGSDDAATKFLVAELATAAKVPYVIASALGLGGNVFVGAPGAACYRCLFEVAPDDAPTCADAGVLGPLVTWIGGTAAEHGLRLLAGDATDAGTIWIVDGVTAPPRTVRLTPRPGCACEARR